jgi:hypothetical protein
LPKGKEVGVIKGLIRRSDLLSERRKRWSQIPYDYAAYLGENSDGVIMNERRLPHPKGEIFKSFMFCIANAKTQQEIELLSDALITLASFQDIGEHDAINPPAIDDPRPATGEEIMPHVKAMKPYLALTEQYWPLVNRDTAHFLDAVKRAVTVNEHMWPPTKRWWVKFMSLGSGRKIPADYIDFTG